MRLSLITAALAAVLAFGALVLSAPVNTEKYVAARGNAPFTNCPSGDSILVILKELQANLLSRYNQIDDHIQANANPIEEIRNIVPLFNAATTQINDLPMDKTCVFDGKCLEVVKICTAMLGHFARRSAKWQVHRTRDLNGISASISEAVSEVIVALRAFLESIIMILQKVLPKLNEELIQMINQLLAQMSNDLGSVLEAINNIQGSIIG